MVIPFVGRVRRRRLIFLLAFLTLTTFYMGYEQASYDQLAQFIPETSPDGPTSLSETETPSGPPPDAVSKETAEKEAEDEAKRLEKLPEKQRKPKPWTDPTKLPMIKMQYGTTARPSIKGMAKTVGELPVQLLLPSESSAGSGAGDDKTNKNALDSVPGLLRRRRLVFVGDVHGQRTSLDALLEKVQFNSIQDHLVLVGDLVNKGPDSAGVVSLAMQLGASAVRGNHDDRVLLAYESMRAIQAAGTEGGMRASDAAFGSLDQASQEAEDRREHRRAEIEAEGRRERAKDRLQFEAEEDAYREEYGEDRDGNKVGEEGGSGGMLSSWFGIKSEPQIDENTYVEIDHDRIEADLHVDPLEQNPFSHGDAPERTTAASLSPQQARWLAEQPAILHLGSLLPDMAHSAVFSDVVVAHAGLVPHVPISRQDPHAVMTMRSLVHPADEVRHLRARALVEHRQRSLLNSRRWGGAHDPVVVSEHMVDHEFRKQMRAVYGPDLKHPHVMIPNLQRRQPQYPLSSPADAVYLPIEGLPSNGAPGERIWWATAWNQAQHALPPETQRTTVIYGHDAVTGLALPGGAQNKKVADKNNSWLWRWFGFGQKSAAADVDTGYTFGLDSGCVYGGQLTALIVEATDEGKVVYRVEQVDCPKAVDRRK